MYIYQLTLIISKQCSDRLKSQMFYTVFVFKLRIQPIHFTHFSFNQADLLTSKFTDHSRNLYFFETIRFWQFLNVSHTTNKVKPSRTLVLF